MPGSAALSAFLRGTVAEGVMSAVVGWVGDARGTLWRDARGSARPSRGRQRAAAATLTTRFDYASLTKPFAATLALVLDRRDELPLRLRVREVFAEACPELGSKTLESLLRHRSGLADWAPLYALARSPRGALEAILSGRFPGAPPGTYSDLGYILWGFACERVTGRPWQELLAVRVLRPLGIGSVSGARRGDRRIAECRCDSGKEADLARRLGVKLVERRVARIGVPQDGNARFLGPSAAHAGLFGDASALVALGREWLRPGRVLTPRQVRDALGGPRGPYALGWARRRVRGTAGPALAPSSFGLTGFAGGSLWIDPRRRRICVLLGHRVDSRSDLKPWRHRFHELAVAGLA